MPDKMLRCISNVSTLEGGQRSHVRGKEINIWREGGRFINARSPRTDSKSGDYAVTAVATRLQSRDISTFHVRESWNFARLGERGGGKKKKKIGNEK